MFICQPCLQAETPDKPVVLIPFGTSIGPCEKCRNTRECADMNIGNGQPPAFSEPAIKRPKFTVVREVLDLNKFAKVTVMAWSTSDPDKAWRWTIEAKSELAEGRAPTIEAAEDAAMAWWAEFKSGGFE